MVGQQPHRSEPAGLEGILVRPRTYSEGIVGVPFGTGGTVVSPRLRILVSAFLLGLLGCGEGLGPGPKVTTRSEPVAEETLTATPAPALGVRTSEQVFQPGIHVYTYGQTEAWIRGLARTIKEAALGSAAAPTCYHSGGRVVRFSIQTEARFADFVDDGPEAFFDSLETMVRTLAEEGFAVHLLLSVHDRPQKIWEGIDWKKTTWPGADRWMPYQPCRDRETPEGICIYDRIFEGFHQPVIRFLRDKALDHHLGVVYLFNEFDTGYPANSEVSWASCKKSDLMCRNEAVAYTTVRGLRAASAVAGTLPVGAKFSSVVKPNSAYAPAPGGDQLAYLLHDVMGPEGFVFALDNIWGAGNPFGPEDRRRLAPLLGALEPGNFYQGEFAFRCVGSPGDIKSGRWTTASEMVGLYEHWPETRASNLFAFNATGTEDGCYALFDQVQTEKLFPEAEQLLKGLWDQATYLLHTQSPEQCSK